MGKQLIHINENTKKVLFEKHYVYHYNTDEGGGICLDICNVKDKGLDYEDNSVHIGSVACCKDCKFNIGFDNENKYIICRKITEAIKPIKTQ